MTINRRFLPPRDVVFLLPPAGQLIGMLGFVEVFDSANRVLASVGRPPLYRIQLAGLTSETACSAGQQLRTAPVASLDPPHTLVVGGGALEELDRPVSTELLEHTRRLAAGATRLASVCLGTFVLGELGLLDERRCTTHWIALEALRTRFPRALVQQDALYTEDAGRFTSAGGTAGVDLALHVLRQDGGPKLALAVAKLLVVFAQRPGGQSQFSTVLQLPASQDDRLAGLLNAVVHEPAADHRVEALAARVGMSPRNFARVFRNQTGETPAAFVTRARVEAAQRALENGDATLAQVASDCGFGSEATLRNSFVRLLGIQPSAYRQRFR